MSERRGNQALRRYPALGFLAVAAALALILPSRLTTPRSNPATLAEFAPVPGRGEGTGDLADLGQAASSELGRQPRTEQGRPDVGSYGGRPGQPPTRSKRCVGRPPRQTEDPLSPPCVAFFEGDNGGATTRGVTKDEVQVVLHWGQGTVGFTDYAEPIKDDDNANDLIGKVYARYFNERYQTYGRYVHFYGYRGHGLNPDQVRADVVDIDAHGAFAVVPLETLTGSVLGTEGARRGLFVGAYRPFERPTYQAVAPRLISYAPDFDDLAALAASYMCRKLVGRVPKHTGNPEDATKTRKFGLMYTDGDDDPAPGQLARALKAEAGRQCSLPFTEAAVAANGRETWDKYPLVLANLRSQNVTTVVPITKAGDPLVYLNTASTQGWHPEWFFPYQGSSGDDATSSQTYPQDEWSHAFGISYDFRRGPLAEQHWRRAFVEACGGCTVPRTYFVDRAYESLLMVFYGIQAAGPKLTPASIDKGLHAVPARASSDPYVPATYFTPGNYSWVKDAKEMWWDPAGQSPGSSRPGCYRLPNDGRRFRPGEWIDGDTDFDAARHPCQGPSQDF